MGWAVRVEKAGSITVWLVRGKQGELSNLSLLASMWFWGVRGGVEGVMDLAMVRGWWVHFKSSWM